MGSDNEAEQDAAEERRNYPEANAVYYGTPPAETGTATASIGSNQICITFPSQEPKLTRQGGIKKVGVYGGDGYHDSGVVLTQNSSGVSGPFIHFGDLWIDEARRCVNAKGRLQNAVVGTEFPVSLRVRTVGRVMDATNPNKSCQQQTGDNRGPFEAWINQSRRGECRQRHYTFRKMAHCAGAGGSRASEAGTCRLWVRVEN